MGGYDATCGKLTSESGYSIPPCNRDATAVFRRVASHLFLKMQTSRLTTHAVIGIAGFTVLIKAVQVAIYNPYPTHIGVFERSLLFVIAAVLFPPTSHRELSNSVRGWRRFPPGKHQAIKKEIGA